VSHYQHISRQPARENIQFQVKLAGGNITLPSAPVTVPYNSRFIWPLNLDLGGVKLIFASAQPICQLNDENTRYTIFKQTAALPAEFVFDAATAKVSAATGKTTKENAQINVRNVETGLGAAIRLKGKDGNHHVIILLDEASSFDLWKGKWQGQERLFMTHSTLLLDGSILRLRAENPADFSVAIFPAPKSIKDGHGKLAAKVDGLFHRFSPRLSPVAELQATIEPVQPAGLARTVPIAPSAPGRSQGMAMQPEDADFAQAAVWRVKLPAGVDASRDLRLRVHYTGDVLRAYHADTLLDDEFYHARAFEIGLRRYGPAVYQDGLVLKILPLREDSPIYITDRSQLKFDGDQVAISLTGVEVIETREVRMWEAVPS
jgi:hypothetical protein